MNFRRVIDHSLDIIVFVLILVGTISGVNYFSSEGIFDAKILGVNNDKSPFSVSLEIDTKVSEKLTYELEVIYKRENLVIGRDYLSCKGICGDELILSKAFFDEHELVIRTNYNGKLYEKKIDFDFDIPDTTFLVNIQKENVWDMGSDLNIKGRIESILVGPETKYFFDVFPSRKRDLKVSFSKTCIGSCDFNFTLKSNIVFEEYTMNVYSESAVAKTTFFVVDKLGTIPPEVTKPSEIKKPTAGKISKPKEVPKKYVRPDLMRKDKTKLNDNFFFDENTNWSGNFHEIDLTLISLDSNFKENGFGRVGKIVEKEKDRYDLDIELAGNGVKFTDVNASKIKNFKAYYDSKLDSDVFYADVENNSFTEATVILRKDGGFVDTIKICEDFSNITSYNSDPDMLEEEKLSESVGGFTNNLCLSGWVDSGYDFEQNNTHVWFNTTHFSAYTAELFIFNPQSYPVVGGAWSVVFNTSGVADLWMSASNGTTWSLSDNESTDLQFLYLTCGGKLVDYEWIENSVYVKDYSCDSNSVETSKVLTGGVHTKQFIYGNDTGYAKNFATDRGSGFLAYIEGTVQTPRYRVFDPDTDSWGGELSALSVGQSIEEIQVACSVARFECALLTVDSGDDVQIQFWNGACWNNGTTCGQTYTLETATNTEIGQRAQLMYEEDSGDLLVVWSGNAADDIEYRVWDGSSWSAEGQVLSGTLATTGTVEWFEFAQEPGTDNIGMAYRTSTDQGGVVVYNGSSGNFGCELGTPFTGLSTIDVGVPNVDIAYEQVSGDLLAVGGITTAANVPYRSKASGTCTYNSGTITVDDNSGDVRIASDWDSDTIIIQTRDDGTRDTDIVAWDGTTGVASGSGDTGTEGRSTGNRPLALACPKDGTDLCVAPYADSNDGTVSFYTYNPSTNSWVLGTDYDGTPAMNGGGHNAIECNPYPFSTDSKIMCIFQDAADDIFAKYFDASSGTWTDTEGASALETSGSPAEYKSFSLNWVIFNSPYMPVVSSPPNGSVDTAINLDLNVTVSDPNSDVMNVSFYWTNGTLIGTDTNVASGGVASVSASNLEYLTTHNWYVKITDGKYWTTGDTWEFTTKDRNGVLSVTLNSPTTAGLTNVIIGNTFLANLTLSCTGILDESCFNVSAWVRYNDSATTFLNITETPFSQPLWSAESQPQWCELDQGESCTLQWEVTANATIGDQYLINVFALSNRTTVNNDLDGNGTINVTPVPPTGMVWNKGSIDLGSTLLNTGNLVDTATLTAVLDQTSAFVVCASGDCGRFTDNFVDNTDYLDTENEVVTFNCIDDTVGVYSAIFSVYSVENTDYTNISLSCQINQTYGTIVADLVYPLADSTTNLTRGDTVNFNVTMSCSGTEGAFCGDVDVTSRQSYLAANFPYRHALKINETSGVARVNVPIIMNFTSLEDELYKIDSCLDDTRLYSNESGSFVEIASQLLAGDDDSWCQFVFLGNVSANAVDEIRYFFYHGYDAGTPSYTSAIASTDDASGWDIDNGLIAWNYSWTGGANGPARVGIYTPSGTLILPKATKEDDSFEDADSYTSFTTLLDGPIYKEYQLVSAKRGTQIFRVYAMQNWFEIENTYTCAAGCNDYHLVGLTDAATWFWDYTNTGTGHEEDITATEFYLLENAGSTYGVGVVTSGSPFSTVDYRTPVNGWFLNNKAYTGGYPYQIFTTNGGGITDANTTTIRVKDPIDESKITESHNDIFEYKVISTIADTPDMYTDDSQPQTCNSLTVGGSNCSLAWDIFPVTAGGYNIDVNATSSLGQVSDMESSKAILQIVWPTVDLYSPFNDTLVSTYTNTFVANISEWTTLKNATLYVWDSGGSLVGTNSTALSGMVDDVSLNFTVVTDGVYYWNYLAYDLVGGWSFNATNYTIIIDTVAPTVNLTTPLNGSSSSASPVTFNGSFYDAATGLKNATVYLWNSTGGLVGNNSTTLSGFSDTASLTLQPPYEGTFYWNYGAFDNADNSAYNATNYTLYWDGTAPIVNLTTPTNDTNTLVALNYFVGNFSDSGVGLKNATLYVYNRTGGVVGTNSTSLSGGVDGVNLSFTLPAQSTYYWNYLVYDIAENNAFNATNYTLYYDVTSPVANLTTPTNDSGTTVALNTFTGNFSDGETGLKNATLYIWNSTGSLIGTNSSNISGFTNSSILDFTLPYNDIFEWNYLVYDMVGNSAFNATNYTLLYDNIPPVVNLTLPLNDSVTVSALNTFTGNFSDALSGLKNTTLYVWNSTGGLVGTNFTTLSGNLDGAILSFTLPYEGIFTWNYGVYDNVGLLSFNATNYTLFYDDTNPVVNLTSPVNNLVTTDVLTYFVGNYSDYGTGLKNATIYLWNSTGGLVNTNSSTITGSVDGTNMSLNLSDGEGMYTWNYLVYDIAGNSAYNATNYSLFYDANPPVVNLTSPSNGSLLTSLMQSFLGNFSDSATGLKNATLYVWNSTGGLIGTNATIVTGNSNSSNLDFTFNGSGIYYWNYLVYDNAGLNTFNATNYSFLIDNVAPNVTLISPVNATATNDYLPIFTGNFTDDLAGMKNATLYVWNSTGGLVGTNFTNVSGLNNLTSLTFNFTYSGVFTWNYFVYDNLSNGAWADTNFTYIIDLIKPILNFVPLTDGNDTYVNRSWTYINLTITDDSNASAYIDFNNSVLLYWNFENASATLVNDSSSYGRDGSIQNGVNVQSVDVIRGDYVNFTGGTNDVINVTGNFLSGLDEFTFSTWIMANATGTDRNIFSVAGVGANDYFGLRYEDSGLGGGANVIKASINTTAGNVSAESAINVQSTAWTHVVMTWKSGEAIKLYVDGSLSALTYDEGSLSGTTLSNGNFTLGEGTSSSNWAGLIDEVLVSNRAIDSGEVLGLYNSKLYNAGGNHTLYKNGAYTYEACAIDKYGNFNCTQMRTININKTLHTMTIVSPLNDSSQGYDWIVDFNATTSHDVASGWVEIDSNGTKYILSNVTDYKTWTTNLGPISKFYHNVTFFTQDIEGNVVNVSGYFYVIPQIVVSATKAIESVAQNSYKVTINVTNSGTDGDINLWDFIDSDFTAYNFTPSYNGSSPLSSGSYVGNLTKWNFTMTQGSSRLFTYNVNGSGDYSLLKNFVASVE